VDSVDIHIPSVQVDVTELAGEVAPEAVTKDAPAPRREWWNSVPDPSEPDPWADEVVTSDSQPTEPAKLLRGDT
jgi:hypothetical protein